MKWPSGDDERVGKEKTLANFSAFAAHSRPNTSPSAGQTETALLRADFLFDDVQQTALTDKDLSDVHQNVTTLDNHPLDGQTFANVLRLADLMTYVKMWHVFITNFGKEKKLLT